jgi:protein-L-isoaspartate(D-aspartate) O-methyltransferase
MAFDPSTDPFAEDRSQMVQRQILGRGVEAASVLNAMETVPRHFFVPETLRDRAYDDRPQTIGWGQTISQPYIVALMTELLELEGSEKVLEIGTGSGYQAAVLSRLAKEVYTIEILKELGERARGVLEDLGYDNIHYRIGDGYQGWPEEAPFDAIIVTAAPPALPQALVDQLKMGGRLVIPVGVYIQDLEVHTKTADGLEKRKVIPVRFVPMVSEPGN